MNFDTVAVGVDPGRKVSGIVVVGLFPAIHVKEAARLSNEEVCERLWSLDLDSVAMEGFRLYPWILHDKRWDELFEVRMIGAVQEICRVRRVPLRIAFPSEVKRVITDEVLFNLGTWSKNPHVTDAFRVFWYCSL